MSGVVGDFDLRIIALGAGVQSSTMYLMACGGEIGPRPDYAIFADTQQEPPWVHEQLDRLERLGSIPIRRATAGDLGEAVRKGVNSTGGRFAAVPFWMRGEDGREAPGRRQCTREYKIEAIAQEIRRILGLKKGQHAAGKYLVEEWIGISVDEVTRAKPSRYSWIKTRWPLLFDRPMRRSDCLAWLKGADFPLPKKSACTFCPYRQTVDYARWREELPDLFDEACQWDELIRSSGTETDPNKKQYISRLLIPLREIPTVNELDKDADQIDLFGNECEGMCGV